MLVGQGAPVFQWIPDVPATGRLYLTGKRSMDVIVAFLAIMVLSPLFLLISLLVLVDSGWPVLHAGVRVGTRPRRRHAGIEWEVCTFRMFKFRTMVADAALSTLHEDFVRAFVAGEINASGLDGVAYKLTDDPRITRLGRWLRSTSLDELPQLFNVLTGTMSLVGPRPVPPYEAAAYEERHARRLAARPGITGIWQVYGRGCASFEEMVGMDMEYIGRRSLGLDLWLLLNTIPRVLSRKGAK
jgi:lipopolysaccharide/colanic/teichoic acid biosynthesis glycosyltransferase